MSPKGRGPRARIVAVSDVYALENLPRLKSLVTRLAAADPADVTLVTMGGDFVAPSILSSIDAGAGMVACLNAVGFTHAILGNHEDDIPAADLRQRALELKAKIIGTNVDGFDPPLAAHEIVVVERPFGRAVKLGLVGVVMDDPTVYRHLPFGGVRLRQPNGAALDEAWVLYRDLGCACVVPFTHQEIERDRELARAPGRPPFPVIVGAHEHVASLESVAGSWLVKAGAEAAQAAVIELDWPEARPAAGPDLPAVAVRLEDVRACRPDPEVQALVERHMARVRELEAAILLAVPEGAHLSSVGTRAKQTTMGTLICSRLRDALGAEACLFNGGGIRGSRDYPRHIAYADLKAEVPFDNEVVVARLPGAVVSDAVRASRAHAPLESGGFLQVDDGVQVDAAGSVVRVAGAPIEADRVYRVAIVRDLFEGLDHIEPLVRFAKEHPERVPPAGSGRDVKVVLVDAFSLALFRQLGGFDAVDTNHDGVLSEPELEAAVARVVAEAPSPVVAGLLVHALDADHDRRVSREDVTRATDPASAGASAPVGGPPSDRPDS